MRYLHFYQKKTLRSWYILNTVLGELLSMMCFRSVVFEIFSILRELFCINLPTMGLDCLNIIIWIIFISNRYHNKKSGYESQRSLPIPSSNAT